MSGGRADTKQRGGWLPAQEGLEDWIRGRCESLPSREPGEPLHPAVERFRSVVDGDPVLRMHANEMIEQVPNGRQYAERHVQSFEHLLELMDALLRTAPEFGQESMVATPLGAILDWTMATPSGFAFYRDPRANEAIRDVLDAWAEFLNGPESLYVLNDGPGGWKSDAARETIGIDQYEYDPDDEHWGFASWNAFFTRRFREDQRPVAGPDDTAVLVAPCEATPYRIASDVQRRDEFWAKGEPYSLEEMLAGDDSVERFVGGTVWQAFLSATNYHRWHAPVSGTVVRAWVEPGTYYSEADAQGDRAAEPTYSQGYLAHVATRAIMIIDADDPDIGQLAAVFIGMSDVSSCIVADGARPGSHVDKGDELGRFQFGGSTVCLVFGPGVVRSFTLEALPQPDDEEPRLMHVRTALAEVRRS